MLRIRIITPEKTIVDEEAMEITLPTISGEITILPSHIPVLTQLVPGTITIKKKTETDHIAIMGGFLEVTQYSVTLLADYAIHGNAIDIMQAKQAKERAEKLLQDKLESNDFLLAQAELQKAILALKVAEKIKRPIR